MLKFLSGRQALFLLGILAVAIAGCPSKSTSSVNGPVDSLAKNIYGTWSIDYEKTAKLRGDRKVFQLKFLQIQYEFSIGGIVTKTSKDFSAKSTGKQAKETRYQGSWKLSKTSDGKEVIKGRLPMAYPAGSFLKFKIFHDGTHTVMESEDGLLTILKQEVSINPTPHPLGSVLPSVNKNQSNATTRKSAQKNANNGQANSDDQKKFEEQWPFKRVIYTLGNGKYIPKNKGHPLDPPNQVIPVYFIRDWKPGQLSEAISPDFPFGLILEGSGVTDLGMRELVKHQNLQYLALVQTRVSDLGLRVFSGFSIAE